MNDHTPTTVGVDIAKAHPDAHRHPTGESARFANDAAGIAALAKWIGPSTDRVVHESTGPWRRALEESLAPALPLARVNAKRARDFARAMGQAARTDAVDARVLAVMGAALEPRRVRPPSRTRRSLAELRTARDALVRDRTAAPNRGPRTRHPLLRRQLSQRLAQIDRQIKALDAEAAKLIANDGALARQAEVLMSMPGIAGITAAGLLAGMSELGRLDAGAAASLAGLAPVTRESGQWRGRGFIRGGRAKPRRLLCMAAVAAIRHNPNLGRRHRELRGRGKPPKVALVAVMRKMLVLANALIRQDRLWTAEPVAATG